MIGSIKNQQTPSGQHLGAGFFFFFLQVIALSCHERQGFLKKTEIFLKTLQQGVLKHATAITQENPFLLNGSPTFSPALGRLQKVFAYIDLLYEFFFFFTIFLVNYHSSWSYTLLISEKVSYTYLYKGKLPRFLNFPATTGGIHLISF